jgi:hypothetical protein
VLRNTEASVDAIEAITASPFPELTRRGSNVLNEAPTEVANKRRRLKMLYGVTRVAVQFVCMYRCDRFSRYPRTPHHQTL